MKWLVAFALLAACDRTAAPSEPPPSAPTPSTIARTRADDLITKFECHRCHDVPGTQPAVRDKHCFGCHQQIHAGTFEAKTETIEKWRGRIQGLRHAPSLAGADRLSRTWVKQFLLQPHDVRPGSIAEMPRLAITDEEATRLATFLVPTERAGTVESDPADIARGEHFYKLFACGRCHRFTGAAVDDPATHAGARISDELRRGDKEIDAQAIAWTLAPDLRFSRVRVQPAQLAAWIENPRGAMPKLSGIGAEQARQLAAFITHTPLAAIPKRDAPKRLPVLARPVSWAEVSSKVFHDTCWHCHAVPDFARGDGGPGNSGGFGFAPRGLDLSSYTGISQGSLDRDGERRSLFEKLPDGTPRVVAHLMARHVEATGGRVDGVRGMPLGLPALTLEQIQLVESWISQGRPQ